MPRNLQATALAAIFAAAYSAPAAAHTGLGDHAGLAHGFMHPAGGLDHVLAMVAVGMLAAHLGGRALWLVPSAFVAMMIAGGVLGFTSVPLPLVEHGIGLSVIVLGVLVALGVGMPTVLAMSVAGLFAIFHGHAHGAELPDGSAPAAYAAGFAVATALLHGAGIACGLGLERFATTSRIWTSRAAGGVMALLGVSLFAQ